MIVRVSNSKSCFFRSSPCSISNRSSSPRIEFFSKASRKELRSRYKPNERNSFHPRCIFITFALKLFSFSYSDIHPSAQGTISVCLSFAKSFGVVNVQTKVRGQKHQIKSRVREKSEVPLTMYWRNRV